MVKLCAPISRVFEAAADRLIPLVQAVSHKSPFERFIEGKHTFLETSFNVAEENFETALTQDGVIEALGTGKYESFACDIGPACAWRLTQSQNGFPRSTPTGENISKEEYCTRAAKNIRWLRSISGVPVQLENLNYFPTGAYEGVCNASWIREILAETDAALLLDVAHAVISSHYLGMVDVWDYLAQLPLERVREIHLSRPGFLHGILEDLHEVPEDECISNLSRILSICPNAEYVTVEYYGDAEKLCAVYERLSEIKEIGLSRKREERAVWFEKT